MSTDGDHAEAMPTLTTEQAYEAAYRFVAQYYERERITPFLLMLDNMHWEPSSDHHITSDPASWPDWEKCVRKTLGAEPLPDIRQPDR